MDAHTVDGRPEVAVMSMTVASPELGVRFA